jgi:hypothetical protein
MWQWGQDPQFSAAWGRQAVKAADQAEVEAEEAHALEDATAAQTRADRMETRPPKRVGRIKKLLRLGR